MIAVQILILLALAVVFLQDLQSRSVYWVVFPALAALLVTLRLHDQPFLEIARSFAVNLAFLLVQLTLLTLYFSVKQRRLLKLTDGWLGWGDVLFLAVCAVYLSFINFLLFYMGSLIAVLAFWLIRQAVVKTAESRIPLAGLQGLLLGVLLSLDWWVWHINMMADDWLQHYL